MGVTPSGVPGSTRPSSRSATAWPMTLAAKMSVPVGKCGPCCSTLPAGRMTSGLLLSCAAISGWVRSMKYRLGNMARTGLGLGNRHELTLPLDRAQCRVDRGDRHVAVVCRKLVRLAGAAALREHVELGAEHVAFRHLQLLALRVAVLAALDIEHRFLVQLRRRVPCAEVDLVMHQALRAEHPHREDAG